MATQVAIRQPNNSFRDKLGRYVAGHADDPDRRRKAMTALTAKMARVVHAVIKTGTEYRPFVERADTRWKDPSLLCREGVPRSLGATLYIMFGPSIWHAPLILRKVRPPTSPTHGT